MLKAKTERLISVTIYVLLDGPWTKQETLYTVDTTGSCTVGKTSLDINDEFTGTFEGIWDLDAHPTDNPPNLNRGATGTAQLFISATQFFSMPIRILTVNVVSTVSDVIKWSVTFSVTGAVTKPV